MRPCRVVRSPCLPPWFPLQLAEIPFTEHVVGNNGDGVVMTRDRSSSAMCTFQVGGEDVSNGFVLQGSPERCCLIHPVDCESGRSQEIISWERYSESVIPAKSFA